MKIKKYIVIALSLALLVFTACAQDNNTDTDMDNARNDNLNTWDRPNNENDVLPDDMNGDDFQNENRTGTGTSGNQNRDTNDDNLNTGMRRPGRLTTSLGNLNNEHSEELSRQIADLPEVQRASVIVNDDRAIVGIELNNDESQNEISSALRSRIEEMVRDANNDIEEISITADGEVYDRIDEMSTEMLDYDGNFFEDMGHRFDELIDAITPDADRNR